MFKNKSDKKIPELSLSFENILICKDKRYRPFIETVIQDPENIEQQNLGTFVGIFEVSETLEESSYIVNYIISVIKKEYFFKPRRGPVESFEAALHKANLALSKLAEHGSVNWIGKLNIVCAVFEKNRLHLAKCGAASALLFRSKTLTNISEGLSEQEEQPNPLRTFDNVSSGKMEIGDKLIISTDEIFEIFSPEEIKKSILRFRDLELVQFFKTALGIELQRAATLIISVKEKVPEPQMRYLRKRTASLNAFSQAAFVKPSPRPEAKLPEKVREEIISDAKEKSADSDNKKTSHIYIKEADHPPVEKDYSAIFLLRAKDLWSSFSGNPVRIFRKLKSDIAGKTLNRPKQEWQTRTNLLKEKIKSSVRPAWERISKFLKIGRVGGENKPAVSQENALDKPYLDNRNFFQKFLPNLGNLKYRFFKLTYEQKLYAFLILAAIFLVPYFGIKISRKLSEKNSALSSQESGITETPLAEDKNVARIESVNTLYSGAGVLSPVNLSGQFFAVSDSGIINLDDGKKFSYPDGFSDAKAASEMDDLNLIFIINDDKKIISFGSISKKFQENALAWPENSSVSDIKTYLTYLYILDNRNSQIYRYPRATGGFGEKTDWLKDRMDLSGASGMGINENVFIADGKSLSKLFRGKRQDFNVEETATPINFYKIYASKNGANLYVLDKENSRIIKLDDQGRIVSQYYNPEIGSAIGLAADEEKNSVYFSTNNAVKSFRME